MQKHYVPVLNILRLIDIQLIIKILKYSNRIQWKTLQTVD